MKRELLFLVLCLMSLTLFAESKPIKVSITYDYFSNDRNESQVQAEQHAFERARQKAMEDKFGVDVTSMVVSIDKEKSVDGKSSTSEDFFSLGETMARGEWLSTDREEVIFARNNGEFWHIQVYLKGTIREKSGTLIDIHYAFVRYPKDRDNCTDFKDGDDIYMHFKSPVDGYLCAYLVDADKIAYCMLPYMNSGAGSQEIKANQDYLFFSREKDPEATAFMIETQMETESNLLYVIFSPNRFTKAIDEQGGVNWHNAELPGQLKYDDFLKWLLKNQLADKDLMVRKELITITK